MYNCSNFQLPRMDNQLFESSNAVYHYYIIIVYVSNRDLKKRTKDQVEIYLSYL